VFIVKPLNYNCKKNITLVEAIPHTGRQHQIRVHLYSIGHRIIGDPIYGIDDDIAEAYLNKELDDYKLFSKNDEILKEFYM
jgi:23S rRNA pseudouridine1911/1915/1917 synthase